MKAMHGADVVHEDTHSIDPGADKHSIDPGADTHSIDRGAHSIDRNRFRMASRALCIEVATIEVATIAAEPVRLMALGDCVSAPSRQCMHLEAQYPPLFLLSRDTS